MTTKDTIIKLASDLILEKGFNAFSFYDLSEKMGIKTASIHYHFPSKTDLGIAVIRQQSESFIALQAATESKDALSKLEAFFSIYIRHKSQGKVCLVGSLCTDLYSLDPAIEKELKPVVEGILQWVTDILKEGKRKGVFHFSAAPRTKALLLITNMLGILQVSRITGKTDFNEVRTALLKELKTKKE
ncbi:MAG: TetR family transcriptional regulator [Chitinophagaceae bacterium]|nr:TetR family transcriptional regulator [Chitinophagaceae bacterium]